MLTELDFKRFLVDEVRRKSFHSIQDSLREVNKFSETDVFKTAFHEWKIIYYNKLTPMRARKVGDIAREWLNHA